MIIPPHLLAKYKQRPPPAPPKLPYKEKKVEPLGYLQGQKCKNFKFQCKLQSLATNRQAEGIELEAQSQSATDVHQCEQIFDPDSGFPLYTMFEVFVVRRKSPFDVQEEQSILRYMFKEICINKIQKQQQEECSLE
uniref:Uncharacterized protein n=1 Tax=Strombidium inclinatum TaxID=197538 RepID=A0A7S3IKL6_9SPIT|mmetsp:Transcript_24980/g.38781  ORF Transcript_24980/g.38781 Transcript_24980/m.38781 type:complete len:136 (+) Transcript_24980:276-683(+)